MPKSIKTGPPAWRRPCFQFKIAKRQIPYRVRVHQVSTPTKATTMKAKYTLIRALRLLFFIALSSCYLRLALAEQRGAGDEHAGQDDDDAGEIEIDQLAAFVFVHG